MTTYRKILVAVDFSGAAHQVGVRALDLAGRYGAGLIFLHVVEYLPPLDLAYEPITTPDWMEDESVLLEAGRGSLRRFVQELGAGEATQMVTIGTPKYEITRIADEQGADLIVIGSHGRHGIRRLLGSTANGVLHYATTDVLAVRLKDS
ncbi:MAG TPA: universal stress protein [Thiotrichales bacterium]|nr:universal stress protein [Thiotrichales bacterium]